MSIEIFCSVVKLVKLVKNINFKGIKFFLSIKYRKENSRIKNQLFSLSKNKLKKFIITENSKYTEIIISKLEKNKYITNVSKNDDGHFVGIITNNFCIDFQKKIKNYK